MLLDGVVLAASAALLQVVFTIYLVPIAALILKERRNLTRQRTSRTCVSKRLRVGVLIPLYREGPESVLKTLKSVAKQTYDKSLMRVYLIIEDHDGDTEESVKQVRSYLRKSKIRYRVIRVNSSRKYGKAEALNEALKHLRGEDFVVIFDADDEVPPNYIEEVASEMCSGASAVTTKVYRVGSGLHAKLLTLDTLFWYDVILPALTNLSRYVPLSGEGLAVTTEFLKKIGGFPKVLTEDAYLVLKLAESRSNLSYLSETFIIEKAPKSLYYHLKQRLRWFQGYYQCLAELSKKLGKLGMKEVVTLLISYASPIAAIATLISDVIFLTYWAAYLARSLNVLGAITAMYPPPIFYWGLALLVIGNLLLIYLLLYTLADSRFEKYSPYVLLMPLYWLLNGLVAVAALVAPREWRKTVR